MVNSQVQGLATEVITRIETSSDPIFIKAELRRLAHLIRPYSADSRVPDMLQLIAEAKSLCDHMLNTMQEDTGDAQLDMLSAIHAKVAEIRDVSGDMYDEHHVMFDAY